MDAGLRLLMTAGRARREAEAVQDQDPSREQDPEADVEDPALTAGRRADPGAGQDQETAPREMRNPEASQEARVAKSPGLRRSKRRVAPDPEKVARGMDLETER